MALVHVPAAMRDLTNGAVTVPVRARSVVELIEQLDARFPGSKARLMLGERLRPGLVVVVDGVSQRSLGAAVGDSSQVHFLAAISGGSGPIGGTLT